MYRRVAARGEGDMLGKALAAAAEKQVVEVWPENWPAFQMFCRLRTQWRIGFNGPTGLDYNVLLQFMERLGLSDEDHRQMLDDVAEMERAALGELRD